MSSTVFDLKNSSCISVSLLKFRWFSSLAQLGLCLSAESLGVSVSIDVNRDSSERETHLVLLTSHSGHVIIQRAMTQVWVICFDNLVYKYYVNFGKNVVIENFSYLVDNSYFLFRVELTKCMLFNTIFILTYLYSKKNYFYFIVINCML